MLVLPESVIASVMHNDKGIEGAFIKIRIPMKIGNEYLLLFGPCGPAGRIEISRKMILAEAQKERDFFVMDYSDLETYMLGYLRVEAVGICAVDRALKAYETYHNVTEYPQDYVARLREYRKRLERLRGGQVKAAIAVEGKELDVNVIDV